MDGLKVRTTAKAGLNRRHAPDLNAKPLKGTLPYHTELLVLDAADEKFYLVTRDFEALSQWLGDMYLVTLADLDDVFFVWKALTEIVEDGDHGNEQGSNNWGDVFTHWPCDSKVITQPFGANPANYNRFKLPGHEGIDIRASHGSPIYAAGPGKVAKVGDERLSKAKGGHNYGVRVYIDHKDGYQSVYAHLDRRVVDVGDNVAGGQIIGYADNTGNSSGSHLHFTVKHNAAYPGGNKYQDYPYYIINPEPLLSHLL